MVHACACKRAWDYVGTVPGWHSFQLKLHICVFQFRANTLSSLYPLAIGSPEQQHLAGRAAVASLAAQTPPGEVGQDCPSPPRHLLGWRNHHLQDISRYDKGFPHLCPTLGLVAWSAYTCAQWYTLHFAPYLSHSSPSRESPPKSTVHPPP